MNLSETAVVRKGLLTQNFGKHDLTASTGNGNTSKCLKNPSS